MPQTGRAPRADDARMRHQRAGRGLPACALLVERGTRLECLMPPRSRKAAAPARPAPEARPVAQRGLTWQAEKLTGKRGQRGNLPGGGPRRSRGRARTSPRGSPPTASSAGNLHLRQAQEFEGGEAPGPRLHQAERRVTLKARAAFPALPFTYLTPNTDTEGRAVPRGD